ncbi:endonuclease [Mycoplasmatota bacterium]|nr:endonuclease [Mycoplasmatota bacterium]
MKKKLTALISIIVMIVAAIYFIDDYLELGVVEQIERQFDSEEPTINTSNLRDRYLLNEDYELTVECEDNVDSTCKVEILDIFKTDVLGEHTIEIKAVDKAGNVSSYHYTYNVIENADGSMYIPVGYYDGIDGLEGDQLKNALHHIIKDHIEYPYTDDDTDIWDILREADEDPNNENNILGFYTGLSIPKDCQDTINPPDFCQMEAYGEVKTVEWNREHIWSKSRGDFSDDNDTAHNDAHHLVAAERVMNSTKNNRFFEDCFDGDDENIEDRGYGNTTCNVWEFEPRDEVKGDVARMIFYMAVRYESDILDLEVINDPEEDKSLKLPVYGDIDDLLRWHIEDPVSEQEIKRNEVIFSYQENRNPFIDLPDLVELIWGTAEDYN